MAREGSTRAGVVEAGGPLQRVQVRSESSGARQDCGQDGGQQARPRLPHRGLKGERQGAAEAGRAAQVELSLGRTRRGQLNQGARRGAFWRRARCERVPPQPARRRGSRAGPRARGTSELRRQGLAKNGGSRNKEAPRARGGGTGRGQAAAAAGRGGQLGEPHATPFLQGGAGQAASPAGAAGAARAGLVANRGEGAAGARPVEVTKTGSRRTDKGLAAPPAPGQTDKRGW